MLEKLTLYDDCSNHIETSQKICRAYQFPGLYMLWTFLINWLKKKDGEIKCTSFFLLCKHYLSKFNYKETRADAAELWPGSATTYLKSYLPTGTYPSRRLLVQSQQHNNVSNLFKVNNKDNGRRHRRISGVFVVNLTYFTYCSSVSTVDFEQANTSREYLIKIANSFI